MPSVVAVVTAYYFRRVARFDPVTAYFAAAPGGLTEMTLIGGALGGDDRTISLIHSARVLLIVLTVPFWFRLLEDYDMAQRAAVGMSFAEITLAEIGILFATGGVGVLVARAARLPAALLTGPMIASAAIHVTGITASRPPNELVAIAQVIVGAAIGCRFAGLPVRHVLRTLLVGSGAIAIMLCGTVAFQPGPPSPYRRVDNGPGAGLRTRLVSRR